MLAAIIVLIVLLFPSPALAVTVNISNTPSTIKEDSFSFNVSVSGAQSGTNYLRANFYPVGTTKYFGYTYNNSSFYNGSDFTQYFPINIDSSGNWGGNLQAKLDTSSPYYSGPGIYNLKVRRYTSSGSYIWSNEVALSVPTNTTTPTPTSSPTPTSTVAITATPSPTNIPTTFTISNIPSKIDSTQTFNASISLQLPDNPNSKFYLKGAFKKADSANYFGLTKVGSDWIKNNLTYSNQFSVTTDSSGNWSGSLDSKPDSSDSGFTGSGDYIFKIARYTNGGSGPTWSNESTINISGTSRQGSTETTSTPTSFKITNAPTPKQNINLASSILSATNSSQTSTPSSQSSDLIEVRSGKETKFNFITFIGGGLILIGLSSLAFIYIRFKLK